MRKHWLTSAGCLALAGSLSGCGSAPQSSPSATVTDRGDTPSDSDDMTTSGDVLHPSTADKTADPAPDSNPRPEPKLDAALEAFEKWGADDETMAASESEDFSKDGKFVRLKELFPEEAAKIAQEQGKELDDLWVLTGSRSKVVFYYDPDDELVVLSADEQD